MSYKIGIEKCRKAIALLSSEDTLEARVNSAFDEITRLGDGDTSAEWLKEVIKWSEQYLINRNLDLKLDGLLSTADKNKELMQLSDELAELCKKIIIYNTEN